MKRKAVQKELKKYFTKPLIFTLLLLQILAVVLTVLYPVLLSSSTLHSITLTRTYLPGELSDEDVVAAKDFSYIDEYQTNMQKKAASVAVLPYFSYSLSTSMYIDSLAKEFVKAFISMDSMAIDSYFTKIDAESVKESYIEEYKKIDITTRVKMLYILRDAVDLFTDIGYFSDEELLQVIEDGYGSITYEMPFSVYSNNLKETTATVTSLLTKESLYTELSKFVNNHSDITDINLINLMYNSLSLILSENVHYNAQYTDSLRLKASDNVLPVRITVKKGDYIIKTDEIITEQALRTIDKINSAGLDISVVRLIAYVVITIFVIIIFTILLLMNESDYYRAPLHLISLFAVLDIILFSQYFMMKYLALNSNVDFAPFLPCFIIPVFFTYITNKQSYGFIASVLYVLILVLIPTATVLWIFYFLALIGCALYFNRIGTNRIDTIFQAFYTAVSCAVVTVIYHFAAELPLDTFFTSIIGITFNVIFTYIVISICLPIYEHVFNVPTKFRLHELCYTDTSMLNRLNQVALGTFNHCKIVSEMAFEAAKAIGANADLARVGGLYHDIGKSEHPEYFIENQQGGHNAHDELNYTLSAAIIKSHVRLGIEKGKEVGLPQEVIDIIGQHHGDDVIQYFYNAAVQSSKNSGIDTTVSEEDFRYTGERPSSAEAAIVMLADCVEAASRTLQKPTSQRYDKLITNIIVSKINRNQLENAPITLENLTDIKGAFIHVLLGRDHKRIKYDTEDKD